MSVWDSLELVEVLKHGGVAVMPTDTIYGLVGRALDRNVVERIYGVKKRDPRKPLVIIIGDLSELKKLALELTLEQKSAMKKYSALPTSFVIDCDSDAFSFLHRGTRSLALRVPQVKELRDLLIKTGPLVATSANTEGLPPAKNIEEARKYFGDRVDFYQDGGEISGRPSKLLKLNSDGSSVVLRG